MMTSLMILLTLGTISLVMGQQATPCCDKKIMDKIHAYHEKCGFPRSLSVGSKTWTFCAYTPGMEKNICTKAVVGNHNVTTTLKDWETDDVFLTNVVTYEHDLKCGKMTQTVQGTNETLDYCCLKADKIVNAHYVCSPESTVTGAPLGGVAIPMDASLQDKCVRAEVIKMMNIMKEMGINTVPVHRCMS